MTAGYRSPSVFWEGGAAAATRPSIRAGYRSLLAFWLGGAWQGIAAPTPAPVPVQIEARRWPGPPIVIYEETEPVPRWQRKREDEEIIIL